jgi:uncharacterized protein (TIGR00730 family)
MNICVFCSSSSALAQPFFDAARQLGERIAHYAHTLVYGGADVGLMGEVAHAVTQGGGYVIGVMPEVLRDKRISYDKVDEMIITSDLRERKAVMATRADAFVALPGGFGTLEELLEVLTLRQLAEHTKPIVLLNTLDFYTPLIDVFEHFYREKFAHPCREFYFVASDVPEVFTYLDRYQPFSAPDKWVRPGANNV